MAVYFQVYFVLSLLFVSKRNFASGLKCNLLFYGGHCFNYRSAAPAPNRAGAALLYT
jgi:hypothetical protein